MSRTKPTSSTWMSWARLCESSSISDSCACRCSACRFIVRASWSACFVACRSASARDLLRRRSASSAAALLSMLDEPRWLARSRSRVAVAERMLDVYDAYDKFASGSLATGFGGSRRAFLPAAEKTRMLEKSASAGSSPSRAWRARSTASISPE